MLDDNILRKSDYVLINSIIKVLIYYTGSLPSRLKKT